MAPTYEQMTSPEYDVMNDAAIDETWKYVTPVSSGAKILMSNFLKNSIKMPSLKHYINPQKDVLLPYLNPEVLQLLNKPNKRVLLKQNIVTKNKNHHPEVSLEEYNNILRNSLYNPDTIAQVQPKDKPNYYTFINTKEPKYKTSVLDMDELKDNYEIVNFFNTNAKRLKGYKNRSLAEGGEFLITNGNTDGAAHLSALSKASDNIINDLKTNFNPSSLFEKIMTNFRK